MSEFESSTEAMVFIYYGTRCRTHVMRAGNVLDRLLRIAHRGAATMIIARCYNAQDKYDSAWRWRRQ